MRPAHLGPLSRGSAELAYRRASAMPAIVILPQAAGLLAVRLELRPHSL
ncbi:hypothetical protein [Zavarzinia sp.]